LRANSHLKAAEYSIPVLGLIFLKFADSRFLAFEAELKTKGTGRREIGGRTTGQGRPLPAGQRPLQSAAPAEKIREPRQGDQRRHGGDRGRNPQLKGVLPRTYQELSNNTLVSLLRSVNAILGDIEGDGFGKGL
jgi:type I restriction enzyme M protein